MLFEQCSKKLLLRSPYYRDMIRFVLPPFIRMVSTRAHTGRHPHPTAPGRMLGASRESGSWPRQCGPIRAAETAPEVGPFFGFFFWAV